MIDDLGRFTKLCGYSIEVAMSFIESQVIKYS